MKNALILHGTNGNSQHNWFPWLQKKLEEQGWKVWVPDLPHAEKPNTKRYNEFLLSNKEWQFTDETILIGHSSGAVEILSLLQNLPDGTKVQAAFLVGAFKNDLGEDFLKEMFLEPYDFPKIKTRSKKFVFIHSDNDPYCPLDHAEHLANILDGKLIIKKGQKHFSMGTAGPQYKEFPVLLELIEKETK
jgi:predicted alpha/beta hydrolase family esterase